MKRYTFPLIVILALVLAACSTMQVNVGSSSGYLKSGSGPNNSSPASALPSGNPADNSAELIRTDSQGAVMVEVTPLNLQNPSDQIEFEVAMNTHMVNLSMNLAALSTLTTDTGLSVPAASWEAPAGGHHVSGKLVFPATQNGKSVLEGASQLTLTILKVDAPARVFEWQLK